jgi:recombinational DNA repair protein RecR
MRGFKKKEHTKIDKIEAEHFWKDAKKLQIELINRAHKLGFNAIQVLAAIVEHINNCEECRDHIKECKLCRELLNDTIDKIIKLDEWC